MNDAAPWSLITYRAEQRDRVGALRSDGDVVCIDSLTEYDGLIDLLGSWTDVTPTLRAWDADRATPLNGVELVAPIRFPGKLICAGANYGSHLAEMGISLDGKTPSPFFFLKPPSSTVIGPREAIRIPASDGQVDWEAELAVVIGRQAHAITAEQAPEFVAGYTIVNDLTSRSRHRRADPLAPPFEFDWLASKGRDSFCPMGPGVTPSWFVEDPHQLALRLWVNGELKQDGATSDMLVGVWDLVASASEIMTLHPGDVIATGTPPGVGAATGEFLAPGDEVAIEIPGLGRLVNPVERIVG